MLIQAEIQTAKCERVSINQVQMTIDVIPVNTKEVLTVSVIDSIDVIIEKFNACPINGKLITGHLKNMSCLIQYTDGIYTFVKLQSGNMIGSST